MPWTSRLPRCSSTNWSAWSETESFGCASRARPTERSTRRLPNECGCHEHPPSSSGRSRQTARPVSHAAGRDKCARTCRSGVLEGEPLAVRGLGEPLDRFLHAQGRELDLLKVGLAEAE